MLNFLFNIFIFPIYGIIEFLYHSVCVLSSHYALISIFTVSFFVNLICLPMYNRAEFYQKQEREIQKKLEQTVKSIKKNFKGDEQFMLLSTYYRQNHYHPIMALRSSLSLLIQIPFFIAAYAFFSQPEIYNAMSVGLIKDLSKPDGLITLFGSSINILPIVMTLINIIAAEIYAKGIPVKERIQMHALAFVFLILLYNSPSGLVIYWTFNNCLSLLKNIGLKAKNTRKFFLISILTMTLAITIPLLSNAILIQNIPPEIKFGTITLFVLTLIVSLFFYLYQRKCNNIFNTEQRNNIFTGTTLSVALLTGVLVPSIVISSSPEEFSFLGNINNPIHYVIYTGTKAIGLFFVWPAIFYYFANDKMKNILSACFLGLLFSCLTNILMFRGELGLLSVDLTMNIIDASIFRPTQMVLNTLISFLAILLGILSVIKNKLNIIKRAVTIIIFSVIIVSSFNIWKTEYKFKDIKANVNAEKMFFKKNRNQNVRPIFELSRKGKNVIIIFVDRAISGYLPVLMEENPEFKKTFTGFTYYPNCVSFFGHTILAYPPLIGGYEYTPKNLNNMKNRKNSDKFKESLLVLPLIFKENGYNATVLNTPISSFCPFKNEREGYFSDNLYDKFGIHNAGRMNTGDAEIQSFAIMQEKTDFSKILERNFLYFSLFVNVPTVFKKSIYANGTYKPNDNIKRSIVWDNFLEKEFLKLYLLPTYTGITEKQVNTFTIFNTECIHLNFNDKPYCEEHLSLQRQVFNLLKEYINYLKSEKIYDNTRIIIVSDHGHWGQRHPKLNGKKTMFNPLLFVKDFDSRGEYKTNATFMTNADTPQIALSKLIENPKNPFTGKNIVKETNKNKVEILYYDDLNAVFKMYNDNTCYYPTAKYITVSENIFDSNKWEFRK